MVTLGSNPSFRVFPDVFRKQFSKFYAPIIQLVEYLICNQSVVGSEPTRCSIKLIIIKQDFA